MSFYVNIIYFAINQNYKLKEEKKREGRQGQQAVVVEWGEVKFWFQKPHKISAIIVIVLTKIFGPTE